MRRLLTSACLLSVALTIASAQQRDPVAAASAALGAASLTSLTFTGFGAQFSVGQSPSPKEPWPRVTLKSYEAALHFDDPALRVELVREQGVVPPRGGGQPFTGEQRVVQFVRGADAWDQPLPRPGRGGGPPGPPGATADAGATPPAAPAPPPPQPQPQAAAERALQIWLTPHGFLKAASANTATIARGAAGTEVGFTMGGTQRFLGVIDAKNEVVRVQTWIDDPVLGDMLVEASYQDYEEVNGLRFPMHITHRQGGHRSFELWVSSVTPNTAAAVAVPDAVRGVAVPPIVVDADVIAPGVHYLTGGSHHSVAIEMRDHVVVVEAPLDEARALAIIATVGDVAPGKPIRAVINSHPHFDHAGGLRTFVDAGATVITHDMNRPFFETAWAAPRTIRRDRLALSGRTAVFETFADRHVLTDGARTIEIHRIGGSPHHDGFAMVYLPAEKLLIEADAYTPPAAAARPGPRPATAARPGPPPAAPPEGGAPPPEPPPAPNPTVINLYENIRRLKLDVAQVAALHGSRRVGMDELEAAAGR